jgi:TetR/AcrR family transcriptional regulator
MAETINETSVSDKARGDVSSGRPRLLKAAAEEFSRHGYAGTSIAAIAARAGVSKSTIFHHFESKEALYLAVIEAAAGDFASTLDQVLVTKRKAEESLSDFQQAHLAHLQHNQQVAMLVLRELQGDGPGETTAMVSEVLSGNYNRLVRYLAAARDQGEIRADADLEVAALVMFAANAFAFQTRQVLKEFPGLDLDRRPERYTSAVSDLIFRGLRQTRPDGDSLKGGSDEQ